jgi:hypothetical protein
LSSLSSLKTYSTYNFLVSLYTSFRSPSFCLFLLTLGWESKSRLVRSFTVLSCFILDPFTTFAFLLFRFIVYFLLDFLRKFSFRSFFMSFSCFSSSPDPDSDLAPLIPSYPHSVLPVFLRPRPSRPHSFLYSLYRSFINYFFPR